MVSFEFWASCVRSTPSVWCPCPIDWWKCTSRHSRQRWCPSSRRRSRTCHWLEAASEDSPPISLNSHSLSLKVMLCELLGDLGMRCFSILYSRKIWRGIKIWRFGGLYYYRQIKIRQNFLLAYIRMAILYRIAKFKSANILAIAILGSTTKFNARQYFRLYGNIITVVTWKRAQGLCTLPWGQTGGWLAA